jgi:hypothetical protein
MDCLEWQRMAKIGRNARCPCGSGKKYKKCCLTAAGTLQADELEDHYRERIANAAALAEALLEIVERLAFKNDLLEKVYDRVGELVRQRRVDEAVMLCEQVLAFCDEATDEFEHSLRRYRSRGKYVLAADFDPHACEIAGLPKPIDGFGDEEIEPDHEMSGGVRRLAAPGLDDVGSEG